MGIQPSEFWHMSLWAMSTVSTYYIAAHEAGEPGLSTAEADDIWDWMQDKPGTVRSPADRAH
jgi:hypothetical protein